jgi:hypothetical protein
MFKKFAPRVWLFPYRYATSQSQKKDEKNNKERNIKEVPRSANVVRSRERISIF